MYGIKRNAINEFSHMQRCLITLVIQTLNVKIFLFLFPRLECSGNRTCFWLTLSRWYGRLVSVSYQRELWKYTLDNTIKYTVRFLCWVIQIALQNVVNQNKKYTKAWKFAQLTRAMHEHFYNVADKVASSYAHHIFTFIACTQALVYIIPACEDRLNLCTQTSINWQAIHKPIFFWPTFNCVFSTHMRRIFLVGFFFEKKATCSIKQLTLFSEIFTLTEDTHKKTTYEKSGISVWLNCTTCWCHLEVNGYNSTAMHFVKWNKQN